MKGILARTNESVVTTSGYTVEDSIAADAAWDESIEIHRESELTMLSMVQATAVVDQLSKVGELTGELAAADKEGSGNMLITPGTVAIVQDTLTLAVIALGGTRDPMSVITGESIVADPVLTMEVSIDGVKDTIKKVYEGIKMAFRRIALTIKKLAAKVVVAVNGTSKKAEKLLKSFTADKTAIAKESKIEPSKALKLLEASPFAAGLGMGGKAKDKKEDDVLLTNMRAMGNHIAEVTSGMSDVLEASAKSKLAAANSAKQSAENTLGASSKEAVLKRAAASLEQANNTIKNILANAGSGTPSYKLDGGVGTELTSDEISELNVDAHTGPVIFYPMYTKGNYVHGVIFYIEELEDGEKDSGAAVFAKAKYKPAKIEILKDDVMSKLSDNMTVLSRTEIEDALKALKPASKQLKSYSDARMKDIDKVMASIDKVAKVKSGLAIFNRLANTQLNHARMFAASTYVAAIFAMAKLTRVRLAYIQANIAMYSTTAM